MSKRYRNGRKIVGKGRRKPTNNPSVEQEKKKNLAKRMMDREINKRVLAGKEDLGKKLGEGNTSNEKEDKNFSENMDQKLSNKLRDGDRKELDDGDLKDNNERRENNFEEDPLQQHIDDAKRRAAKEQNKNKKREKKIKRRKKRRKNIKRLIKSSTRGPQAFAFTSITLIVAAIGSFLVYLIMSPITVLVLSFGAFAVLTADEDESSENTTEVADNDSGGSQGVVSMDGKVWPVPHTMNLTSSFGPRWGTMHNGVDIAGPGGSSANLNKSIVSFLDGEVIRADPPTKTGGYGNLVVVQHGSDLITYYAHLNKIDVKVGDKVKAGDHLGGMGTTGNSTGVHLHFETREKSGDGFTPVHPKKYLKDFDITGEAL